MKGETSHKMWRRQVATSGKTQRAKLVAELPPVCVASEKPREELDRRCATVKSYYQRNKDKVKARLKASNRKRRNETVAWYYEQKAHGRCACGEANPLMLDYHHRDPNAKVIVISALVRRCTSKQRILAEISKCDLVCVRCHREHEYKRLLEKYPDMPRYPGY